MGKNLNGKLINNQRWLVAAMKNGADLPHGYEEAAEINGLYKSSDITPAKDQLHNRLRVAVGIKFFFHLVGHGFTGCQWYPGM